MAEFVALAKKYAPQEGICQTRIDKLITYRASQEHILYRQVYEPGLVIGAQGTKHAYLDGKRYNYSADHFLALFMPMPLECSILKVSPAKPLLGVSISFERNRLAQLLVKMDRIESVRPQSGPASGIFAAPLKDHLLDAIIRLLKTLDSPTEAAILGESIIDEIYFRVLSDEQGGALVPQMQQRGQIQQISRAVEFLHQNLDKTVAVDDLADIVHMSGSGFHKKFKEVMHLSPLQYAKLIKLNKAQAYIMDGKSISEAGYMVGYNSPAQFSREYKRQFGVAPSAT